MTDLEKLKQEMDGVKEITDILQKEYYKKNNEYLYLKRKYEQELWKDKTCKSCMYSIVIDFSSDGEHNKCGCEDAPCTCCHNHCEYYKPHNTATLALKEALVDKEWGFCELKADDVKGLKLLGYDVYDPYDEIAIEDMVKIMQIVKGFEK